MIVADRVAVLGEVVGEAGVTDIAEGADLIATSDDIRVMSAVVASLGVDDLERGLQIARIGGELSVVAEVVRRLDMPVLSAFLADRSAALEDASVDGIMRAGAARAVSGALASTGRTSKRPASRRPKRASPG